MDARHAGNSLWLKLQVAGIAQQPDPAIRFDQVGVESISVGVKNILISISVEVRQFNAAGSVRRIRKLQTFQLI